MRNTWMVEALLASSGAGFEDEIEGCLGRATEAREPGLGDEGAEPRLTGLRAERWAALVVRIEPVAEAASKRRNSTEYSSPMSIIEAKPG